MFASTGHKFLFSENLAKKKKKKKKKKKNLPRLLGLGNGGEGYSFWGVFMVLQA